MYSNGTCNRISEYNMKLRLYGKIIILIFDYYLQFIQQDYRQYDFSKQTAYYQEKANFKPL